MANIILPQVQENTSINNETKVLIEQAGEICRIKPSNLSVGKLSTKKTISLTGSVTGSGEFDGSDNLNIVTTASHNYAGSSSVGGPANSANMLNNHANSTVSISTGSWSTNPWGLSNPKVIWGQSFRDSTVSSDSGDMSLVCAANSSSGGYGVHLCIDGGIATLGNIHASMVYGAVWNDYAEYRINKNDFKPGQVVYENGDDTLSIANTRLQRGCSIISDTFGFAIGETDQAKCPVAVSGRVLAYPYESREEFAKHIGWPVCSGPNGTVSIMTEEEEEKYPSRIIGTISAVPEYNTWGTGNVSVNGRIWIKIK